MDCLVAPVTAFKRGGRHGYRQLAAEDGGGGPVTVLVGKEKKEFRVDPFVLQEIPFRVLIDLVNGNRGKKRRAPGGDTVVLVEVDTILFEHMLWLMNNDCSSLFNLNLTEVLDFYSDQD